MSREAKFNFLPEHLVVDEAKLAKFSKHTASVNVDVGYLRFSPAYIIDNNLENKFVKIFVDTSKKTIGWAIMHETDLDGLKHYRQILKKEVNNAGYKSVNYTLHMRKLIKTLNITGDKKTYSSLPIKTYKRGMLEEDIYYVEIE